MLASNLLFLKTSGDMTQADFNNLHCYLVSLIVGIEQLVQYMRIFFSFFSSCFISIYNLVVYDKSECLYVHN